MLINFFILLTFVISATIGFIVVPRIVTISKKKGLFDYVNERKVHTSPIPRLGGVSFLPALTFSVAFVMGLRYFFGVGIPPQICYSVLLEMLFLLCGFLILYFTGLADDLVNVSFKYKLVAQFLASSMVILSGVYVNSLHGFIGVYQIHPIIGYLLTIILVSFVINAINLIDGIDGLATGLSSIALFALGLWFWEMELYIYSMLSVGMLGVIVPFFIYNVFGNRHKIFMGDTGSLLIGFLIAFLSAKLCMIVSDGSTTSFRNAPTFVFSILFIPLFDAARVFVERIRKGKSPFHPDKTHIHHKFLALGFSHKQAMVTILFIAGLVILLNYYLSKVLNINMMLLVDIALGVLMMVTLHRIKQHQEEEIEGSNALEPVINISEKCNKPSNL
ncbi:glycosyltransferase family 4 protein [Alistipes sp. ZOR0009]|uniref:glycosyltransferase family 4 protein n=1 Tax=Alistipes sp. ZOR0009 TaxID=1339253 RepID=UPI000690CE14|nr:MraY family glycosyltransferase [Alistipes sp. ZOR0009]